LKQNIFNTMKTPSINNELFTTLLQHKNIKIERIVSNSIQNSIENIKWYNQDHDEWILLLEGEATLGYNHPQKSITLYQGDSLFIPANQEHCVYKTDTKTVWLAIHIF
jgi:cupin 2 domain-containing protein